MYNLQGLLFGLFTSIMFGTQVSAIWNDETGIESLKKEEARWIRKSRSEQKKTFSFLISRESVKKKGPY